jgi:hypothetical protein
MTIRTLGALLCGGLLLVTTTSVLAQSTAGKTQQKEPGGFVYIPGTDNPSPRADRAGGGGGKGAAPTRIFDRWGNDQITVRKAGGDNPRRLKKETNTPVVD